MTRRVYLHVGAPKTGTTYLQDRLALNRRELARHGVHYPLGIHASHFTAAVDLLGGSWGPSRDGVAGDWDALVRRTRRHDGTVVISHEILAAAGPSQIRRAMADLADSEVHVVYSARDLARQIPAEWQEGLKHGGTRTFRRFVKVLEDPRRRKLWFWRVQHLPDVLTRWGHGLTADRIHVVTVPQAGAARTELWDRYCAAFGIDPVWTPHDSRRENVSIGTAEAGLLRRLNQRLKAHDLSAEDYRFLVKEVLVHRTLALREDMTRVTLPPEAFGWVSEVTDQWIDWVQGSGVDVIGELEDLRPQLPPSAEENAAARPRKGDMLDPALEALVAMVLEGARRTAPENQLPAKVGRAARRFRGR